MIVLVLALAKRNREQPPPLLPSSKNTSDHERCPRARSRHRLETGLCVIVDFSATLPSPHYRAPGTATYETAMSLLILSRSPYLNASPLLHILP